MRRNDRTCFEVSNGKGRLVNNARMLAIFASIIHQRPFKKLQKCKDFGSYACEIGDFPLVLRSNCSCQVQVCLQKNFGFKLFEIGNRLISISTTNLSPTFSTDPLRAHLTRIKKEFLIFKGIENVSPQSKSWRANLDRR